MDNIVDKFINVFSDMRYETVSAINDLYAPHVVFVDPFHEIHGVKPLAEYFASLYENVAQCQFTFGEQYRKKNSAALFWTMTLRHKTFDRYNTLQINGSSLIRFDEKIHFHQDYFDAGALIYERIPVVGKVIRSIKARV